MRNVTVRTFREFEGRLSEQGLKRYQEPPLLVRFIVGVLGLIGIVVIPHCERTRPTRRRRMTDRERRQDVFGRVLYQTRN